MATLYMYMTVLECCYNLVLESMVDSGGSSGVHVQACHV